MERTILVRCHYMFLDGLDQLDQKIIQLLTENARMSYSEIGQKVGISRVAVKMRVQTLEQNIRRLSIHKRSAGRFHAILRSKRNRIF